MKPRNMKPLAAVSMVLAVAGANAGDNPFKLVEYGPGMTVAADAVDMKGNKAMIKDETGFAYGGDQMGKYASGKVGTGAKDPGICGSFSEASCSMTHLSAGAKMKDAAAGAADKMMDKAMDKATDMMKK